MAKRALKSTKKKRDPAWLSAAREKLRAKAPRVDRDPAYEEAVADALMEMAAPEIHALPDDATDEDLEGALRWSVLAYNQPIMESFPGEGREHPGEKMREALELAFEQIPGLRERFHRMVATRMDRFAHLTWMIKDAKPSWGDDGEVRIDLSLMRLELKKPAATE
jgi:hypothetical protein